MDTQPGLGTYRISHQFLLTSYSISTNKFIKHYNCSFLSVIQILVIPVSQIYSSRGPVCASTLPNLIHVFPTWISLFISLDLFVASFTCKSCDNPLFGVSLSLTGRPTYMVLHHISAKSLVNPLSEKSSLWVDKQLVMPSMLVSVSTVEIFLFVVLLCVIIKHSINGTSALSSEFSCWCWNLHTGSSASSAVDSWSELLESTGAANTVFCNGLSVVGISHSSMDTAQRCLAFAFVTKPINWSLIL